MSGDGIQRLRVLICGAVQGVGFRPFVVRQAAGSGLSGWVRNTGAGLEIEAEGRSGALVAFLERIRSGPPANAVIQGIETAWLEPAGLIGFEILESVGGGKSAVILPDIAACERCLAEVMDPRDRRHRYPFTNCTHCGPRFSIIEGVPYDRANTTMRRFEMCPECRREYEDPADRRFHAQPNACPACGPQVALWDAAGKVLAREDGALMGAAGAIRAGKIVAVKGLGGFHLVVDARNGDAVSRLRRLKRREEKPFALMAPDMAAIRGLCDVSDEEAQLLRSPAAPIVLLDRRTDATGVTDAVAPGNPGLGVMLPYTPMHHLLMVELGFAVVATSGNIADEPICTDEADALRRLGPMCDLLMVHDRPIARHVDDSIARVILGKPMLLRRARGYAPMPVSLREDPGTALAVGAHLKNTVALSIGKEVFLSQHIGDLETPEASDAFMRAVADLPALYDAKPGVIACDLHPAYVSTAYARGAGLPVAPVQHHLAHVFACAAENDVPAPYLGVAWDGTGFGEDGTVWGGEFFTVLEDSEARFASLAPFRLVGGEAAVREPRRSALGALIACFGDATFSMTDLPPLREFSEGELAVLKKMSHGRVNAPMTTSAGRLFDAVASLFGLQQVSRFEGQAAMRVEFAAAACGTGPKFPIVLRERADEEAGAGRILDWRPMLRAILEGMRSGEPVRALAAGFHIGLADGVVTVARAAGLRRVLLTGGCFQNRLLMESVVSRLRDAGFSPAWHQRVPPNDGGIALGQIAALLRRSPTERATQ